MKKPLKFTESEGFVFVLSSFVFGTWRYGRERNENALTGCTLTDYLINFSQRVQFGLGRFLAFL